MYSPLSVDPLIEMRTEQNRRLAVSARAMRRHLAAPAPAAVAPAVGGRGRVCGYPLGLAGRPGA